jgi:hypothetical protein
MAWVKWIAPIRRVGSHPKGLAEGAYAGCSIIWFNIITINLILQLLLDYLNTVATYTSLTNDWKWREFKFFLCEKVFTFHEAEQKLIIK